ICPSREGASAAFQHWADSRPPLSMFLFSDGSRLDNTSVGAGWYGYWGAVKQMSTCGHLSLPHHEIFDAEVTAATEGLKNALFSFHAQYTQNIYVLLDNQEAAKQLQGCPRGSSQRVIQTFQETAAAWPKRPNRFPAIPPGKVQVQWVPGHAGIMGNEQA